MLSAQLPPSPTSDACSTDTPAGPLGCSFLQMPSRQERRRVERDAAKRAASAGQAGAAGAGAAAAAAAAAPLGDWTTQTSVPAALQDRVGIEVVAQMAADVGRCNWKPGR